MAVFARVYERVLHCNGWLLSFMIWIIYSFIAMIGYALFEPSWSYIQSFYFVFTQVSTVGYGCMAPSGLGSRIFTMMLIVVSVPMVSGALAEVFRPLVEGPYHKIDTCLFQRIGFLCDDDDDLNPPGPFRYYGRGLIKLMLYAHVMTCPVLALVCLAFGQNDNYFQNSIAGPADTRLNLLDALYFTVITSSTVGFGDMCPTHDNARLFTICVAGYGVAIVTLFINECTTMVEKRRMELALAQRLQRETSGADLIDKLDSNGDGVVDRCEFVVGMLIALDLVKKNDVNPIMERFDDLDTDKSGTLTREDVIQILAARSQEIQHRSSMRSSKKSTVTIAPGPINPKSPDDQHPPVLIEAWHTSSSPSAVSASCCKAA